MDKLRVAAPASAAGEKVRLFRVVDGQRNLKRIRVLNRDGDVVIKVRDVNGRARASYVVRLVGSKRVEPATSNVRRVR